MSGVGPAGPGMTLEFIATLGPSPTIHGLPESKCDSCGGDVFPVTGPDRWHHVRNGLKVLLPVHLRVQTCLECGETYTTTDEATAIEDIAYRMLGVEIWPLP